MRALSLPRMNLPGFYPAVYPAGRTLRDCLSRTRRPP